MTRVDGTELLCGAIWRRAHHLLEAEALCVVGYLHDGYPSAALVLFFELSDEEAFLFHTMDDSRKALALGDEGFVSLTIGPARSGVETLQVEGLAARTHDDRHRSHAIATADRKTGRYGSAYLYSRRSILYRVEPTWMRYSRYPSEQMPGEVYESPLP